MIYCKKIDDQYSDIEIEGDNYTIEDEISTTLCVVHGEYLKNQRRMRRFFGHLSVRW